MFRLIGIVSILLVGFKCDRTQDGNGTTIRGLWRDDIAYSRTQQNSSHGWFCRNAAFPFSENVSRTISKHTITGSSTQQQYWGPISRGIIYSGGRDNVWSRWFQCHEDADRAIVQYFTATCAKSVARVPSDRTVLYVDDIGDHHFANYQQTLRANMSGFDPYAGHREPGFVLDDERLQAMCRNYSKGRARSFYWVQKHGAVWIPPFNAQGKRIRKANDTFRTMIKVQTGSPRSHGNYVLLFNITMECAINDENGDEEDSNDGSDDSSYKVYQSSADRKLNAVLVWFGKCFAVVACALVALCCVMKCCKYRSLRREIKRMAATEDDYGLIHAHNG